MMLSTPRPPSGRVLVWEDDFDGTTLGDHWWASTRANNPNNEEEAYTPRPTNVRVADSCLILQCHREEYLGKLWTSGRVDTNDSHEFHYGRIEARMKLPHGQGLWPAFWMLGAASGYDVDENGVATWLGQTWSACGEIDIHESYNDSVNYKANLIAPGHLDRAWYYGGVTRTDWNVYGIEWTHDSASFYVNDIVHATFPITKTEFQKPFYLILNLAVGGAYPTDETTPDGAEMFVDWVRVYTPESDRVVVNPVGLTLDKPTATVAVGSQVIITPTITPAKSHDKGIRWTCSDDAVARVVGGYVTGYSAGTVTITATTWNGLIATSTVTVS